MVALRRIPDTEPLEGFLLASGQYPVVLSWLESKGYPKIENVDAYTAALARPGEFRQLGKGYYIDDHWGRVVLCQGHTSSHASLGDWLVWHSIADRVQVVKPPAFAVLYEEI